MAFGGWDTGRNAGQPQDNRGTTLRIARGNHRTTQPERGNHRTTQPERGNHRISGQPAHEAQEKQKKVTWRTTAAEATSHHISSSPRGSWYSRNV